MARRHACEQTQRRPKPDDALALSPSFQCFGRLSLIATISTCKCSTLAIQFGSPDHDYYFPPCATVNFSLLFLYGNTGARGRLACRLPQSATATPDR